MHFNGWRFIWTVAGKTSLSKLEHIQKRAFRFVLDDYQSGYTESSEIASEAGIKIMV